MAKDVNLKFRSHDPRQSPDMTPEKNSRKGGGVRVSWPLIFRALNANSSKMAKDVNLKFCSRDPRQSPDMTSEKNSWKGGGVRSCDPYFLRVKCQDLQNC